MSDWEGRYLGLSVVGYNPPGDCPVFCAPPRGADFSNLETGCRLVGIYIH